VLSKGVKFPIGSVRGRYFPGRHHAPDERQLTAVQSIPRASQCNPSRIDGLSVTNSSHGEAFREHGPITWKSPHRSTTIREPQGGRQRVGQGNILTSLKRAKPERWLGQ